MGMFDNYPSPPDYVPNNMIEVLPCPPKPPETLPRPVFNLVHKLIGYSWRHGDTVDITYHVDEYIEKSAELLSVDIEILDHNRKSIYQATTNGDSTVTFHIDKDLSAQMIRGNYYITFKLYDETTVYISTEMFIIVK